MAPAWTSPFWTVTRRQAGTSPPSSSAGATSTCAAACLCPRRCCTASFCLSFKRLWRNTDNNCAARGLAIITLAAESHRLASQSLLDHFLCSGAKGRLKLCASGCQTIRCWLHQEVVLSKEMGELVVGLGLEADNYQQLAVQPGCLYSLYRRL